MTAKLLQETFEHSLCNAIEQWECAGGRLLSGCHPLIEKEHNRNGLLNMLAAKELPGVR